MNTGKIHKDKTKVVFELFKPIDVFICKYVKDRIDPIVGIYKITSPSGKIYIGLTIDVENRFYAYKNSNCKKQKHLHSSFEKYGVENHVFEIIHFCKEEELSDLEIYYEELFKATDRRFGLNLRKCGGSRGKHSEESIKKMSKSQIGKKKSEESIQKSKDTKKRKKEEKIRNGTYVKTVVSEESKKKQSESMKGKNVGKKRSDKFKKEQSERMKSDGQKPSPQTIARAIEVNTGAKRSMETRKKQSESQTGKKRSKESIAKSLETKKIKKEEQIANGTYVKQVLSEEAIKKSAELRKDKKLSEEHIKNIIESRKINKEEKIANGTYVKITFSAESIAKREATKKRNREEKLMKAKSKNMRISNHVNRRNKKIIRQERLTMIF